jgi:hypothetical protein
MIQNNKLRDMHMINKDICEELENLVREDNFVEIRLKKRNSDF